MMPRTPSSQHSGIPGDNDPARNTDTPSDMGNQRGSETESGQDGLNLGLPREPEVHTARLMRLPPFWKANPNLWFAQAEAAFQLSRVSADDTKFRYVVFNLDQEVLPFVSDILENPPPTQKYQALKDRILTSFGETSESKLRRLLRGHEMGEEKPSNFLQRLRNLAGRACGDSILRTLFLEQLPESIRAVLAVGGVEDLTTLAMQADKAMEVMKPVISAVAIHSTSTSQPVSTLEQQIAELKKQVEALTVKTRKGRSKSRGRGPRDRSVSRKRNVKQNTDYYYYHAKFGKEAYRCRPPCTWQKAVASTQQATQEN
ncbi:uncharacterized protein [Temnothorax nylanderi]|uniref:uncharacterized protein n=1 Tax=Temnothorax nylanderi TaxID=102681 RepID=UPI003A83E259